MLSSLSLKSVLRWSVRVLATLALLWGICQFIPARGAVRGTNPFRAPAAGRPLIIAHAGGAGLNPANTLEAFAGSVELGCDMLEMDVRLTKDGVLVTHHDATIERTSDGAGAVFDHTLAELKALNFGYYFLDAAGGQPFRERPAHLAALEELFQTYRTMPMTIEIKDRGETGRQAGAVLAGLIAKHQMRGRVLVASFDDATLDAFRQVAGPDVATSTARGQTRSFVLLNLLRLDRLWAGGVMAAQVPADPHEAGGFDLTRPGFIRAAHARNMAIHFWTVNEPAEMLRLIALGADGIVTDYPDRARRLGR